jgi:hypothetical protein
MEVPADAMNSRWRVLNSEPHAQDVRANTAKHLLGGRVKVPLSRDGALADARATDLSPGSVQ